MFRHDEPVNIDKFIESDKGKYVGKVYMTVAYFSLLAALGCFTALRYHVPDIVATVLIVLGYITIACSSPTSHFQGINFRLIVASGLSFAHGLAVSVFVRVYAEHVSQALVFTTLTFLASSYAAVTATSYNMMVYRSIYSSISMALFGLFVSSFFIMSTASTLVTVALQAVLVTTYLIFEFRRLVTVPVMYEAQYVTDALQLFGHALQLFIKLLQLLETLNKKEDEKRRTKRHVR